MKHPRVKIHPVVAVFADINVFMLSLDVDIIRYINDRLVRKMADVLGVARRPVEWSVEFQLEL